MATAHPVRRQGSNKCGQRNGTLPFIDLVRAAQMRTWSGPGRYTHDVQGRLDRLPYVARERIILGVYVLPLVALVERSIQVNAGEKHPK